MRCEHFPVILEAGQDLGPYRVEALLGEGGMGSVYRALDTRLDRQVAIKVLPEDVISDPDRVGRFQREARLLAALNHHGIASIYDLEELDDRPCLVLELVPGQTLQELVEQSPLELEKARELFSQAAEALAVAHREKILHRDLKPGNIMVTPAGQVKLLDFGLAKALDNDYAGKAELKTQEGTVLGTASYLAPEQLGGEELDGRADVWGLACCLYEAVTGRQAFPGESLGAVLTAVMTQEPDWSLLPEQSGLHSLLKAGLSKDREARPTMAEFGARLKLGDSEPATAVPLPVEEKPKPKPEPKPDSSSAARWRLMAVPALIAVLWLGMMIGRPTGSKPPVRPKLLAVTLPGGSILPREHPAPALDHQGTQVVFPAVRDDDSEAQLYLRRLDQPRATLLEGTEGGLFPFFAPDGKRVGFFDGGGLSWVPVDGGAVTRVVRDLGKEQFLGATWLDDRRLVFATTAGGLQLVDSDGGQVETLLAPDPGEGDSVLGWPVATHDGQAVIFSRRSGGTYAEGRVERLEVASGRRTVLREQAFGGRPAPDGRGLLYLRGHTLMKDDEVVLADVWAEPTRGETAYAAAAGVLVSVSPSQGQAPSPVWLSSTGEEMSRESLPRTDLRLSPDNRSVAFRKFTDTGREIWLKELESGTERRVTHLHNAAGMVFSPDGKSLAFGWDKEGPFNLYSVKLGSAQPPRRLTRSDNRQFPKSWAAGWLLFEEEASSLQRDIRAMDPQGKVMDLLTSRFDERAPALSFDGRWLAYLSDATGQQEVYLKPFPKGEPRLLGPGCEPVWSEDGRLLFRRDQAIMALDDPEGEPEVLFEANLLDQDRRYWDVTSDGERFLMLEEPSVQLADEVWVGLGLPGL